MSSKVIKFSTGYLIIITDDVTGEKEFSFAALPQKANV